MNSTKHSKDNKRKDTELTEEQSTEKQTEKCVRLSNTNATVEGILFFLLKENKCRIILNFVLFQNP